ncbi:hypothetical protein ACWPMX_02725 [Tsuneonella sp. HG094]
MEALHRIPILCLESEVDVCAARFAADPKFVSGKVRVVGLNIDVQNIQDSDIKGLSRCDVLGVEVDMICKTTALYAHLENSIMLIAVSKRDPKKVVPSSRHEQAFCFSMNRGLSSDDSGMIEASESKVQHDYEMIDPFGVVNGKSGFEPIDPIPALRMRSLASPFAVAREFRPEIIPRMISCSRPFAAAREFSRETVPRTVSSSALRCRSGVST